MSAVYPIFNFPLRAGAKKAIEFFGINDLSILKVGLLRASYSETIQNEFSVYFNSIKPYIIAYRLESIEKEDVINDQIIRLKNLQFKFCTELICIVQNDKFSLSDNNYIYNAKDKTYYIKANHVTNIDSLRGDPLFVDNFSEILLNIFSTSSEKQQFESLLRDSKATIDYNIKKLLGEHALEEAKVLLGLVDSRKAFWYIIFTILNHPLIQNEEDYEQALEDLMKGVDFTVNYDDIGDVSNIASLAILFKKLNISVKDFNSQTLNKISTYSYNLRKLNNHLSKNENSVKQSIWNYLNINQTEQVNLLSYFNRLELIKNEYDNIRSIIDSDFSFDFANTNFDLLRKHFEFINFSELPNSISFYDFYKENRKKFDHEDLLKIESCPEFHSLLYFKDIERVKDFLYSFDKDHQKENNLTHIESQASTIAVEYAPIITTLVKSIVTNKSSIYTPSSKNGNQNKVIGNRVEDLAFRKLVDLYGESYVIHKSKETEWEHYDIKYSRDQGATWIYAEIKSAALNRFTISIWEKEFGENNSDDYEIWVWCIDKFIVLNDFYKNHPILNPTEFEVILENLSS